MGKHRRKQRKYLPGDDSLAALFASLAGEPVTQIGQGVWADRLEISFFFTTGIY